MGVRGGVFDWCRLEGVTRLRKERKEKERKGKEEMKERRRK